MILLNLKNKKIRNEIIKNIGFIGPCHFSENQAQNYLNYNVGNAHSHNDYMQEIPFGRHIMLTSVLLKQMFSL
jgi:hypothetical protein